VVDKRLDKFLICSSRLSAEGIYNDLASRQG
jgi:hypothetical protein